MPDGKEEGKKEEENKGKIEGISIGELKKKKKIAKSMLQENIPIELILKITGLSQEELKELE